jgi:predicted nucleic acid-binding protein
MRLVVDTNRIIASLVRESTSRKILLSDKFEFLTVGFAESEIEEHRQELQERAKLTEKQLDAVLAVLFSRIFVVSDVAIQNKMPEARKIMDKIDPSDTPFMALALAVENDGIWSDDRHFLRQRRVKTWKTKDLLGLVRRGLV